MLSFSLIIKVIIAATLLYFVLNAFFRYHLQNELSQAILFLGIMIVLIFYSDSDYNNVFSIIIGVLFFIYSVIRFIFYKKRISYYILLNFNSNHAKNIIENNEDLDISYKTYSKYFCLIKFYDYETSSLRKLFKLFEKSLKEYKLKLTLKHYWVVILYLVIVTILWRF